MSAAAPAARVAMVALLGALTARPAAAGAFLEEGPRLSGSSLAAEGGLGGPEAAGELLSELGRALGASRLEAVEKRMGRIEEALKPTFAAMPKNEHGSLDRATALFALHRLFVSRHGWFVLGLEPGGESWGGAGSPATILQEKLPEHAQELFESRLAGRGLDLGEVAVMGSMVESLVHEEAVERLRHTYRMLNRSVREPVDLAVSHEVVDLYMVGYILGFNFSRVGPAEALSKRDRIEEAYPTWPETVKFLRAVQASAAPERDSLAFEDLAGVIEIVGERYGRWQDEECRTLKSDLMRLEDGGTGRVRLADFYRAAVNDGNWQFSESTSYLRQLGALDESDPSSPLLLIPNYISSPSNCVASSRYYSVCCLDECEGLLSSLERRLGSPQAPQDRIAELVAALPSATVPANRTLSAALVRKLAEVAERHGGIVPLHGRLFRQWMHVAYPRECPFPHVTGTTRPQRDVDWMAATGQQVAATTEEMAQQMEAHPKKPPSPRGAAGAVRSLEDSCGLWTMEEELVSVHARPVAARGLDLRRSLRSTLHGLALAAAGISSSIAALRTLWAVLEGSPIGEAAKREPARFCV